MNDEEFYNCFTLPKKVIDRMLDNIAVELIQRIVIEATRPVKYDIRTNPDDEIVKRSFKDIVETSKKKVFEMTDAHLIDAMDFSFKKFDEIQERRKE